MLDLKDVNDDSILVFEYFTASGVEDLSIVSEAVELIRSLVSDLKDEDILAIAKEYVFIPGVSKEVLQMAYGIGNRSLENGQKVAAKYFLGIANQYLQDTEIEKKISEL